MTYRVIIEPEAQDDIAEAFAYIHARSEHNAARWLRGVYKCVYTLEQFPHRCGAAREQGPNSEELRQLLYKSHRIIFAIRGDEVHVLHVRHAARRPAGDSEAESEI